MKPILRPGRAAHRPNHAEPGKTATLPAPPPARPERTAVFAGSELLHTCYDFIESVNEGALTLSFNGTILYANPCFARMTGVPLEKMSGMPFQRFFPKSDQAVLRLLLKQAEKSASKIKMVLLAAADTQLPVIVSIHHLARKNGSDTAYGVIVTDTTDILQREEQLRALSNSLMNTYEAERKRVAVELHESISQLIYGILIRCDILARELPENERVSHSELTKLRDLLIEATKEVRSMASGLRPTALDDLGLVPVLRSLCDQFKIRTGILVDLTGLSLQERLPASIETELYRICLKAFDNVEKYSNARHLSVSLNHHSGFVQLIIRDDGIGFNPYQPVEHKENHGFGLIRIRERAQYAGGTLRIKSAHGAGTELRVRIPLQLPSGQDGRFSPSLKKP